MNLCFLKMLVNAVKCGVTVRIFNNQNLVIDLRSEMPTCDPFNCLYVSKLSRKLKYFNLPVVQYCYSMVMWLLKNT